MRDSLRAYATVLGIGFRAAPLHATVQLVTGIVFAVATPVTALGVKLLIDAATTGDLRRGLLATALVAGMVAGSLVCVFYYTNSLFTVRERAGARVSQRLMALIGGTEGLAHHEFPQYLDQVHRIQEERDQLSAMVNATAGILRVTATLGVSMALLGGLHPLLLLLPLLAVVSVWLAKGSRDIQVAAQEATSGRERLRRHLFQVGTSSSAAKELRVFGSTDDLLNRHHEISDQVVGTRNRASWRSAARNSIDGVVTALGMVGAIALALSMAVAGEATVGDVVLVVVLAAQLTMTVGTAAMYVVHFLSVLTVARRFRWLAEYARQARPALADRVPVPRTLRAGIELRGVNFRYPRTERAEVALSDVDLRLPPGAVVAVVGENGAGKTTLVKLLCGLYRPDSGQILVDGIDLARFDTRDWQSRVAAVFQDFVALEFLAGETVGVGDLPRMADRTAVGAALTAADATGLVEELPDGLETQLGARWDGGVDLSGGQWHRLALARGLMRGEPVLAVFDEPTAALDAQAEHALFERFTAAVRDHRRQGTVTLLVSHRFSTVRMADLIVVLDKGTIVERGNHDELMASGGLYAELYDMQSRAYL
ncbi:ABC transporter ATP-binding protein [Plantactinospora sp. WMMC1484]|uniref:ABC transporter ATP-binding protein n=1 Tax=Plantactinospora sp. WMMC1484 TaxID=3404122 RepID=UPI003BF5313D